MCLSPRIFSRFLANGLVTLFRAAFFFANDKLVHRFCRLKKNHAKINSVNRTYAVIRIFNESVEVGTAVNWYEPVGAKNVTASHLLTADYLCVAQSTGLPGLLRQ